MKKTLTIVLAIIMMFMAVSSVFAEDSKSEVEIIFSENFEGDLSRWRIIQGVIGIYYDNNDTYVATHVGFKNEDSIESIAFDVNEKETYTVSADIKGKNRNQYLYIEFFDENDKKIQKDEYSLENKTPIDIWNTAFIKITAPAGSKKAKIELKSARANTECYYDNIVVCKGEVFYYGDYERRKNECPAAEDNSYTVIKKIKPAFYENFEEELKDWVYNDRKSETKVKREEGYGATGGFGLKLKDDISNACVGITTPYFEAEGEAEYTLYCDFMKESGTDKPATAKVVFYSQSNSRLGSFEVSAESVNWKTYSSVCKAPKGAVKAHIVFESGDKTGICYADNIMVVKTKDKPIEETKLDKINKSSIVLFVGSANALVNGNKTLIDTTNDKVIATIVDGRTLVPVRFIAENFGAEVLWDDATRTVTLTLKDKTVKIVLDKAEIDINGEITAIDVPAQSIEGRTMLPLRAFVENVMGKKIFWDARGLIVITDSDMLDATADKDTIDALADRIK